jgi:hypothetical protein
MRRVIANVGRLGQINFFPMQEVSIMTFRLMLSSVVSLFLVWVAVAEPIPVVTAHGKVVKADKETLSFQPRDESGKFGKAVVLKVTGTSKITTLAPQMRDKKQVMAQKDSDAKDLTPGQFIAVIYATPKGQEPVLLSAVVQAPEK